MNMIRYGSVADYWKVQAEEWQAKAEKNLIEIKRLRIALEHCINWLPEDCAATCEARALLTSARPYLEPRLRYVLEAAEAGLSAARGAADRAKERGNLHEREAQAGVALAYADIKMRIAEVVTMHLSD